MRTIGVGLGVGLASAVQVADDAEPNPNLLRWSEALDNAVWVTSNCTVTGDALADPEEVVTADSIAFTSSAGQITQDAGIAATSGATVAFSATLPETWSRSSVTGTFDGVVYVFSIWLLDNGSFGTSVSLRIIRVAGSLCVKIVDEGDSASFYAWGAKLETPGLTAYVKREGT